MSLHRKVYFFYTSLPSTSNTKKAATVRAGQFWNGSPHFRPMCNYPFPQGKYGNTILNVGCMRSLYTSVTFQSSIVWGSILKIPCGTAILCLFEITWGHVQRAFWINILPKHKSSCFGCLSGVWKLTFLSLIRPNPYQKINLFYHILPFAGTLFVLRHFGASIHSPRQLCPWEDLLLHPPLLRYPCRLNLQIADYFVFK